MSSACGGAIRKLISVSNGVHQEIAPSQSGDPIIVCDQCDQAHPDGYA